MSDLLPVTVDNCIRAESDLYFSVVVLKGGLLRDVWASSRGRTCRRPNNHPDELTLPDASGRFMSTPNRLPIMKGVNYTVRLYRPRKAVLDGTWTCPEPVAVS